MKKISRSLVYNLALAMAYCAVSQISYLAAYPPFNVSMIWLPAGIAVAAAMYWGGHAFPGILVGAMVNNFLNLEQFTIVLMLTALGSALQACVIAMLAGRFARIGFYARRDTADGMPDPFTSGLLTLASIAFGSLIAPSIGALTLCASQVNAWNDFVYIWLKWWIGDLTGILALAPITWHAVERRQLRPGFGDWLLPMAFSASGMGLFFYLLHENLEANKQIPLPLSERAVWLFMSMQHLISLGLLIVFLTLCCALVYLSYRQWHADRAMRGLNTELQNQLAREKHMIESLPLHIWTADANGLLDYVSPQALQFFGLAEKELLATGWNKVVHPEDLPAVTERWKESVALCIPYRVDFRLRRSDGKFLPFSGAAMPTLDRGAGVRWFGSNTDLSQHVALMEQLRESQKLEAIGQLTGGLAHDFNNLLGIVVGNLDEIDERLPKNDTQLRQRLRIALDAAMRGAEVTRSLLAVARRQPMAPGTHDLNALLAEILPLARSSAGSAVTVHSDFAGGELLARVDKAGLSNVLLNLVINARDAMKDIPGHHEITLRTRKTHFARGSDETLTPGWYAVLEVTDNGAGMNEQVRAQAFQPFFTTKELGHGTGLGLAMVYGYVTQLGGTARIKSEESRGTTVQLYLPTYTQAQGTIAVRSQTATPAVSPALAPPQLKAPGGRRVLVVDDEQALCDLACDWLASLGYQPTGVYSAQAALERLAAGPFDILFTDIVMPGNMDGVALVREALLRHTHLRVVLTSGYAKGLDDINKLPARLVNKPYRKSDLARVFLD